ncbi:MAG TPA: hypothetical protein VFH48_30490 [Chloroflexota bacterium]|nr:hypothetical protein [Chloroflexota bacterium]
MPDQAHIQHALPPSLDIELEPVGERLKGFLFADEAPVLGLDVLGQEIVLLHDLDDAADRRREAPDGITVTKQALLHVGHRRDGFAVGGIDACLENGGAPAKVGENVLHQALKVPGG